MKVIERFFINGIHRAVGYNSFSGRYTGAVRRYYLLLAGISLTMLCVALRILILCLNLFLIPLKLIYFVKKSRR